MKLKWHHSSYRYWFLNNAEANVSYASVSLENSQTWSVILTRATQNDRVPPHPIEAVEFLSAQAAMEAVDKIVPLLLIKNRMLRD